MFDSVQHRFRKFKFTSSSHFARMKKFYGSMVKKGDWVFDVGSNHGERAMVFEKLGAKLVCVEPQQACVQLLHRYFDENPDVHIVDKACGAVPGMSEIAICSSADTISTMSEKWMTEGRFSNQFTWEKKQPVEVVTLDMLIQQFGWPTLCKIDVEGFETEVLKGLHQKVGVLSFEFTREFFDDALACMDMADALGKAAYNFCLAENMYFEMPQYGSRAQLLQLLQQNTTPDLWGDIYVKFI
jgi:FkbM family methyltransferase